MGVTRGIRDRRAEVTVQTISDAKRLIVDAHVCIIYTELCAYNVLCSLDFL